MGRHVSDQRKPESVYGQGDEPDPRFSQASERTALAWMRTALALVAAGIAIISI
jgi:putative membrane protein